MNVRIVLLSEDRQTDMFLRQFLFRRFSRRFVRRMVATEPFAAGHGSGEQWVRKRFPVALEKVRSRQGVVLIVAVDADAGSTEARRLELDVACREGGVRGPGSSDPVVMVVPRRNIETWFHYLGGHQVDEVTRYPRLRREADCKPLADRLYEMCHERQQLPDDAPASLVEACHEYPRLTRAGGW